MKSVYDLSNEDFKKFINEIKLIWGVLKDEDFKEDNFSYVSEYEDSTSLSQMQSIASLKESTVQFDSPVDQCIRVNWGIDNDLKGKKLNIAFYGHRMTAHGNCKLGIISKSAGTFVNSTPGGNYNTVQNKEMKKIPFVSITSNELCELANLYFTKKENFKEELLKLTYKFRGFNRLIPVFKNQKLHRFVKLNNLNDLEDDEEFEENKVRVFFD